MSQQTINNGDTGLISRIKINENFTESYQKLFDATRIYTPGESTIIDNSGFKEYLCNTLTVAGESPITTPAKWDFVGISEYIPTAQPDITIGVPNTLELDCTNQPQCLFEPQKETGVTQAIDVDYTLSFLNTTDTLLVSKVVQLTGTRIITMSADVLVSNPSSIGVWVGGGTQTLTLSAGTADIIEFQFLRYSTASKWILKVGDPAT